MRQQQYTIRQQQQWPAAAAACMACLPKHTPNTHLKLNILVLKGLDVEADRRDGLDVVVGLVLQAVQDRRLARVVQTEDQDADLLRPKQGLEDSAQDDAHGVLRLACPGVFLRRVYTRVERGGGGESGQER